MKSTWLCLFLVGCGTSNLDVVDLTPTTLGTGLVAHWTFDQTEGPELLDESNNRRNGVISGATFTTDGRFGGALHFKAGDSVTVENFPYARSSWSFSAWVRIAADDDFTDDFGTVISTEVLMNSGWQFQTRSRSEKIYWTFAYWNQVFSHYECVCFEEGTWSHVTVVRDGSTNLLSFYVGGRLARPSEEAPPILPGTSTLYMGKWMGPSRLFSGSIDDVAIYDRALSVAEVEELDRRPPPRPSR